MSGLDVDVGGTAGALSLDVAFTADFVRLVKSRLASSITASNSSAAAKPTTTSAATAATINLLNMGTCPKNERTRTAFPEGEAKAVRSSATCYPAGRRGQYWGP